MAINVRIRALGVFRELFGSKLLTLELEKDASVKSLVQKLVGSEVDNVWLNALILVNGREISVLNGLETVVSDEDEIVFLPVSHGG